ncbi:hypothetical protein [Amnibacterium kyonggiense]
MDDMELFRRTELVEAGIERPDRAAAVGYERVRRGVYAASMTVDGDERYRRLVRASSLTVTGRAVFSHESAAVILRVPVLGRWPEQVHLLDERRSGGRSQRDVVRHCLGLDEVRVVIVDGLAVTGPARTAFDIALSRPFVDAVVVADAVLRLFPDAGAELAELVAAYGSQRGHRRLRRVLAFADGRSGSVGESVSRCEIDRLGFAAPDLQVEVRTEGRPEYGDFGWRRERVLGEFDGEIKYRLDRYRRGGSVEDVVIREKNRENRMRVEYPSIARWDWSDLQHDRLERVLLRAGVPRVRRAGPSRA